MLTRNARLYLSHDRILKKTQTYNVRSDLFHLLKFHSKKRAVLFFSPKTPLRIKNPLPKIQKTLIKTPLWTISHIATQNNHLYNCHERNL